MQVPSRQLELVTCFPETNLDATCPRCQLPGHQGFLLHHPGHLPISHWILLESFPLVLVATAGLLSLHLPQTCTDYVESLCVLLKRQWSAKRRLWTLAGPNISGNLDKQMLASLQRV